MKTAGDALGKTTTQLIHEQEQYLDAVLDAGKDASWSYMEKLRYRKF